jgi:hypothetical protein
MKAATCSSRIDIASVAFLVIVVPSENVNYPLSRHKVKAYLDR